MTDLTSVAAVKAYAGITGSADDALLATLVTAYSQAVRSYTNRDFDSRTYAITRDGQGTSKLLLPQFPVTAVSSVIVDGRPITAQSAFGLPGFRFTDTAIILDGFCFSRGYGNVQIGFTAGYATIPEDIAEAVNEWITVRFRLRDKGEWSSKTLAGETVSLSTKSMPDTVKMVLDQRKTIAPL